MSRETDPTREARTVTSPDSSSCQIRVRSAGEPRGTADTESAASRAGWPLPAGQGPNSPYLTRASQAHGRPSLDLSRSALIGWARGPRPERIRQVHADSRRAPRQGRAGRSIARALHTQDGRTRKCTRPSLQLCMPRTPNPLCRRSSTNMRDGSQSQRQVGDGPAVSV